MEGPEGKQRLPVLHWLTVLNEALHNLARAIALNFIHQLHRFHDADHLSVVDVIADLHKRRRARRRRFIERAHNGRLHNVQSGVIVDGWFGLRRARATARLRQRQHAVAGRRSLLGRHQPRQSRKVCAALLLELDAHLQVAALNFELADLVFLQELDEFPQFVHLIRIHLVFGGSYSSIQPLATGVSTCPPVSVTATMSSIRIPNRPGK